MLKFEKILFFLIIINFSKLNSSELLNIRFGDREGYSRIVFDLSKKNEFNFELKENSILEVSFANEVKFDQEKRFKNKIISEIKFNEEKNKVSIIFKSKIELKNSFEIKKTQDYKNFRIVFDYLEPNNKKVIIIDPGHGGRDSGAVGAFNILEKKITLKVAQKLKKKCDDLKYFNCILTRKTDEYISLRDRVEFARKFKGDLFISLHADFIKKKNIRGVSIYTLSEKASDKEAEELAKRENKVDLIGGLDLAAESTEVRNILIDLTQRETLNQSSNYVEQLIAEFKNKTRLLSRTHRFAGFAVLKAPDIPSVLIEMGYLSNKKDAKLLVTKEYQNKIVNSIYNATINYFNKY